MIEMFKYVVILFLLLSTATAQEQGPSRGRGPSQKQESAQEPIPSQEHVPSFIFTSQGDGRIISSEMLEGQVYIVDFWATWCPPCVEELPDLTEVYEEFHDKGFEIVSLSFDEDMQRVNRFREERFSMPWLHGHVGGFNEILALSFSVENIPHIILVDRDGYIVASGDDLRGPALRSTLLQYLN